MFPESFYRDGRYLAYHTRNGLLLLRHGGPGAVLTFVFNLLLSLLVSGAIIAVLVVLWVLGIGADFASSINNPWLTLAMFALAIWLALGILSAMHEDQAEKAGQPSS